MSEEDTLVVAAAILTLMHGGPPGERFTMIELSELLTMPQISLSPAIGHLMHVGRIQGHWDQDKRRYYTLKRR